jgi:hypothetical protein
MPGKYVMKIYSKRHSIPGAIISWQELRDWECGCAVYDNSVRCHYLNHQHLKDWWCSTHWTSFLWDCTHLCMHRVYGSSCKVRTQNISISCPVSAGQGRVQEYPALFGVCRVALKNNGGPLLSNCTEVDPCCVLCSVLCSLPGFHESPALLQIHPAHNTQSYFSKMNHLLFIFHK